MTAPGIPFPEMPRQVQQDVREHEVLLAFRDDDHAELFRGWLHDEGWDAFNVFAFFAAGRPE